jgi:hypothetical protein
MQKNKESEVSTGEGKEIDYPWEIEQEKILKKWADKGQCYKAMHERSYKRYWCLNAWFSIPVIILSTLTGTGNFAQDLFGEYAKSALIAFGAFNIFSAILSTIAQYTGVAQKLESHRIAAITWDKFSRKIQIELAKKRKYRSRAKDFINNCQESFDRLIEVSPLVPNDVIRWFNRMIETGEFEEDLNELNMCCFECFCFPCGCKPCNLSISNKSVKKVEKLENTKKLWKDIELPEILGIFKPTEIAEEIEIIYQEPKLPPPLAIPKDTKLDNSNEYNIFVVDDKDNHEE